jgi:hypothetical protein
MRGSKQMLNKTKGKEKDRKGKGDRSRKDLRLLDVTTWAKTVYNGP